MHNTKLKEARLINLGTMRFQLCDILETVFSETVKKKKSMIAMS